MRADTVEKLRQAAKVLENAPSMGLREALVAIHPFLYEPINFTIDSTPLEYIPGLANLLGFMSHCSSRAQVIARQPYSNPQAESDEQIFSDAGDRLEELIERCVKRTQGIK